MHLNGYIWRPTGVLRNDAMLDVVDGVVLHVDAGNASSLFQYFDGLSSGIESTAFLPKSPKNHKEQYRSTWREADAQAAGNSWIVDGKRHGLLSLETQGYGSGLWTPYQIEGIKDFILQTHEVHKFPLVPIQEYHGRGIGYHAEFAPWNPNKHSCPGPDRIRQFKDVLVPWLATQNTKFYVIKPGDTAASIAQKFNISILRLWQLNPKMTLPPKDGLKIRIK